MPGYLRSFYISDDLFEKLKEYAERKGITVNRALTEILTEFFAKNSTPAKQEGDAKQHVKQEVKQTANLTSNHVKHNIPVKQDINLTSTPSSIPPSGVEKTTQQAKEELPAKGETGVDVKSYTGKPIEEAEDFVKGNVPKVTQEVKAPPSVEDIELNESEFPKGEAPLTGVSSSERPKEPPVNFSWATRREKLRELVVRWVDVFRKWDTRELVNTFRRCKGDDPTREAVIIVMKERFEMKLPETEKATIRNFFKDDEVIKFMEEHGIEGIKKGVTAEDKPAEGPEKKEEGG
jgi:hypothetical protein